MPTLKFPLTITTPSATLAEAIEDVDIIAESVAFVADKEKLLVEAEGDMSKARIEIPQDASTNVDYAGKDSLKSRFSIEYLKKMIAAGKLADVVSVQFDNDYPLKLEFKDVDKLVMSFILAPRVDTE